MDTKKILVIALLLVGAGFFYTKFKKQELVIPTPEISDPVAPNVTAPSDLVPPPIFVEPDGKSEKLPKFSNYQEALEASKKYDKPIFLYFGADWCGYCKKMKLETLANESLKEKLNKEYITCIIDIGKDRPTARKYKVLGIPAYMVVDKYESIIVRDSGFKSKDEMLNWLQPKNVSLLEDNY